VFFYRVVFLCTRDRFGMDSSMACGDFRIMHRHSNAYADSDTYSNTYTYPNTYPNSNSNAYTDSNTYSNWWSSSRNILCAVGRLQPCL